jgi:F-type H+-transporting ATPase subunit a
MSDKSILSYIPGYDDAVHGVGESLGHVLPSVKGNHHLNAEPLVFLLITLVVIFGAAFLAKSKFADAEKAVIPDEKLSIRTFFELFLGTVFDQMEGVMGEKNSRRFFPLIATCAVVIFFGNFLGLVPGMMPPTDALNINLAMGLVIFVATHVAGAQTNGAHHFTHLANPTGQWWGWFLAPIMLPIELISHFVRPVSLALRLMCNMIGDHKVLGIFMTLTVAAGIPALLYPMPIMLMGCIVCTVQTAVFCLLSVSYIALALEEQHHDEEHAH